MKLVAACILVFSLLSVSHMKEKSVELKSRHAELICAYAASRLNPVYSISLKNVPSFCSLEELPAVKTRFLNRLLGERFVNINSVIPLAFEKNTTQSMCMLPLTQQSITKLCGLIKQQFYYKFIVDGVPFYSFIGEKDRDGIKLFTHFVFNFATNNDKITEANVRMDKSEYIVLRPENAENITTELSFTVLWTKPFDKNSVKVMKERKHSFFETNGSHWRSLINVSLLIIIAATAIAMIVKKILFNDFQRYENSLQLREDAVDDYGWKVIHSDVFRLPKRIDYIVILVGIGAAVFVLLVNLYVLSSSLVLSNTHSDFFISTLILFVSSISCFVYGVVSGALHRTFNGKLLFHPFAVLSAIMIPFAIFLFVINAIGLIYGSTMALSLFDIVFRIGFPIAIAFVAGVCFGCYIGFVLVGRPFVAPCRVNARVRTVPPQPMTAAGITRMAVCGFVPALALANELNWIFKSLWGSNISEVFGLIIITLVLAAVLVSLLSVVFTYIQLVHENHLWFWSSFIGGGSLSFFVFLFGFFYYFFSGMSGFLQFVYYFGCLFFGCFVVFAILGSVGFLSSFYFVKKIYGLLKAN